MYARWLRPRWVWLTAAALPLLALADDGPRAPPGNDAPPRPRPFVWPTRTVVPANAVAWAWEDLQRLSSRDAPYVRYVWCETKEQAKRLSLTLNYNSRVGLVYRPPLAVMQVIRVDLRWLYDRGKDLDEALALWENFRYDPRFSRLVTGDGIKGQALVEAAVQKEWKRVAVTVPRYKHTDGYYYTQKWEWREVEVPAAKAAAVKKEVLVVDEVSRVVDQKMWLDLVKTTGSEAPLVSAGYLIPRMLGTKKFRGLFKELYGGLYYDFTGIAQVRAAAEKSGKADLDEYLKRLRVDTGAKGFLAFFNELPSSQKLAMFRSDVTSLPRAVVWFSTLAVRPGEGASIVFVTMDLLEEDVDIGRHPLYNLVNNKPRAYEVIALRGNTLQEYTLFGEDGQLLDEGDINVAADHEVPKPYHPVLESGIGCIRCHGPKDGWQPMRNDAIKIIKRGGVDVLDDVSVGDKNDPYRQEKAVALIARLYSGSPDLALSRARDDYAQAVLRATGRWDGLDDQKAIIPEVSAGLARDWAGYKYTMVDRAYALKDLGFQVEVDRVEFWFKVLVVPDRRADTGKGFVQEDPAIAALHEGVLINRSDYDLVRDYLAERVERRWAELQNARNN